MGLLARILGSENDENNREKNRNFRICRIEELEPRDFLDGAGLYEPPDNIDLGLVYHEDYYQTESSSVYGYGEMFTIAWNGGATGTTLNEITINLTDAHSNIRFTDKFRFTWEEFNTGSGITLAGEPEISNDGKTLTIKLNGFTAETGKFIFRIDVAETLQNGSTDNLVEGAEIAGATITALFSAPDYDNLEKTVDMRLDYSESNDTAKALTLPEYDPQQTDSLHRAGAFADLSQKDLAIKGSLSGYVYDDRNNNGIKETGEQGIEGVRLELFVWNETAQTYVTTGRYATTDVDGYYLFEDVDAFKKYLIQEMQPDGWKDGKESAGSLGGALTPEILGGKKIDNDIIAGIKLHQDEHGKEYNFGEFKGGTISGSVYDEDKNPIPNTVIELYDENGNKIDETKTDENGYYEFTDLPPGNYTVREQQPDGYCDGDETVGSLGGTKPENDTLGDIPILSGDNGTGYDFQELRKGSLSGYVYVDANENGTREDGEKGIGNVTLTLYVWDDDKGEYVKTGETVTDSSGYYKFEKLCPGKKYQIREAQPEQYDDGEETVGSLGGDKSVSDIIGEIEMPPNGQGVNYNFGELARKPVPPPPVPPVTPVSPPVNPPFNMPHTPSGAVGMPGAAGTPAWQMPHIGESLRSGYGGGGTAEANYSWHLSVINAGYPRANGATDGIAAAGYASRTTMFLSDTSPADNTESGSAVRYVSVAWTPLPMAQSSWYVRDKNGKIRKRFTFGPDGGIPVVGDFNGDGMAEIAVYHNGNWYIDINGNGQWDEEDLWCEMGSAADQPVVGDWDGDGKTDIGVFGPQWSGDQKIIAGEPGLPSDLNATAASRPKNVPPDISISASMDSVRAMKHSETGGVRLDVVDHVFRYGSEGDKAFTGDFSGDGVTKIGVYRDGKWYIDKNGNGKWDDGDILVDNAEFGLGTDGIPVVGDFNGDGIDNIGLFVNGVWHLDTTGDFRFDTRVEFGQAGDFPVVGDFEGDGIAQLAVYRASVNESLQTLNMPATAPAAAQGIYAKQFTGEENGTGETGGTETSSLQHRGRSQHTPHSNAPLKR